MSCFRINVDRKSIYINESGSVIGIFCFSVNNWYFPSKKWDDFIVILLAWLTKKIIELSLKNNKTIEMCFMEGCFKVSVSLSNESWCIINFIEGEKLAGDEEVIHKTITIPFEDLKSEVKKACELLLHMKETKELDFEEDYEKLKESYQLLCNS